MYAEKAGVVNSVVLLALSGGDEPRKGGTDPAFLQERSGGRNSRLDCRLMYVQEQICARVGYLDKARSGSFPSRGGDGGEERLMSSSNPSS